MWSRPCCEVIFLNVYLSDTMCIQKKEEFLCHNITHSKGNKQGYLEGKLRNPSGVSISMLCWYFRNRQCRGVWFFYKHHSDDMSFGHTPSGLRLVVVHVVMKAEELKFEEIETSHTLGCCHTHLDTSVSRTWSDYPSLGYDNRCTCVHAWSRRGGTGRVRVLKRYPWCHTHIDIPVSDFFVLLLINKTKSK